MPVIQAFDFLKLTRQYGRAILVVYPELLVPFDDITMA